MYHVPNIFVQRCLSMKHVTIHLQSDRQTRYIKKNSAIVKLKTTVVELHLESPSVFPSDIQKTVVLATELKLFEQ